jgi:TRAP-type C4-dicarboxylate transport system substrate-binding protein
LERLVEEDQDALYEMLERYAANKREPALERKRKLIERLLAEGPMPISEEEMDRVTRLAIEEARAPR